MKTALLAVLLAGLSFPALAQNPYDPPTSVRPPPNVMLLMDATRTTLITGAPCGGPCHTEGQCGGWGGSWSCSIYGAGNTRLQLARRVLTGGWGWNTTHVDATNGSADALLRTDGVMDQYKVRWGVTYYDGLGTRLVVDPTANNLGAQQAVIDFGYPGRNERFTKAGEQVDLDATHGGGPGWPSTPILNSYVPYFRTVSCCGSYQKNAAFSTADIQGQPWYDYAAPRAPGRQSSALQFIRDYWKVGTTPAAFDPAAINAETAAVFDPGAPANDAAVIDGDVANVLVSAAPNGCRRNFTIMMLDGEGGGASGGLGNGDAAAEVANLQLGNVTPLPSTLQNQVFAIHFGSSAKGAADRVGECGYDGSCGDFVGVPGSFEAAPGGVITDLSAMYAAFAAIFSLVLHGNYIGAPPTVTRYGDNLAVSLFTIQNCDGVAPFSCNIGRPGSMQWHALSNTGADNGVLWDAGVMLRSHDYSRRNVYTSANAAEGTCGALGSCALKTATLNKVTSAWPFNNNFVDPLGRSYLSDSDFVLGRPNSRFANGVYRGDTTCSPTNGMLCSDDANYDPYKLMDIANSQPVVVGAPSGIGEDIERWRAFLNMSIPRTPLFNGNGVATQIKKRDQVVYLGANDGMLHAFLASADSGATPSAGRTVDYNPVPPCAFNAGATPAQLDHNYCGGSELWGYAPRMLQPFWSSIRGGHYFMVDGTPIVSDVLFTKGTANPGSVCTSFGSCGASWEYRTVLLECLGGGGPGCFAMDVTNPFNPLLLWERHFSGLSGRGTSTSKPQIARVKKIVGTTVIPYYVALMGGGLNETSGAGRRGSFLAVGLEDGAVFSTQSVPIFANADFSGSPTCLDTDADGFVDTCYIATTEADIYKVRLVNGDPSNITMARFFNGRAASGTGTIRSYGRVVAAFDTYKHVNLFFATGNFEDVQNAGEVNYMFKVVDTDPSAAPIVNGGVYATACGGSSTGIYPLAAGEKVVFDPVISSGVVYFTSFKPNANPCLKGDGYLYGIHYDSCGVGIDTDSDGNADTSKITLPVQGLPTAPVINEAAGQVVVALDSGGVLTQAAQTPPRIQFPMQKLWWRTLR